MTTTLDNKAWTQTFSGGVFYFHNPEEHDYKLVDIAHALAHICRYGGSCIFHYSVGYHSLLLAEAIYRDTSDPELALDALMHDASEAYVGDMKRPIKRHLPKYMEIENRVEAAIRRKFQEDGLTIVEQPLTKEYDTRIVVDERQQVMQPCDHANWGDEGLEALGVVIKPQDPAKVAVLWLQAFGVFSKAAIAKKQQAGATVLQFSKVARSD